MVLTAGGELNTLDPVCNALQMDKASIIKDAIEYIEQLQAEERRMLQEVRALEAAEERVDYEYDEGALLQAAKRTQSVPSSVVPAPVEVLELRVSEVGDRVLVVNVTCGKGRDAMARVCRAVEELRLRVIASNITSVAGCLMDTIFVEVRRFVGTQHAAIVFCLPSTDCSAFLVEFSNG